MNQTIDARDESRDNCRERELIEDRFLAQFAALEESLTLLQAQVRSMSESVELFGGLARQIRRSTCPATDHRDKLRCHNAEVSAKVLGYSRDRIAALRDKGAPESSEK